MEIDLEGKIAIVTGAGRGIGREIAETLGREGATAVVTDVRQDLLDDVAATFRRHGWAGRQYVCDVRDAARIRTVVEGAAVGRGHRRGPSQQLGEVCHRPTVDCAGRATGVQPAAGCCSQPTRQGAHPT